MISLRHDLGPIHLRIVSCFRFCQIQLSWHDAWEIFQRSKQNNLWIKKVAEKQELQGWSARLVTNILLIHWNVNKKNLLINIAFSHEFDTDVTSNYSFYVKCGAQLFNSTLFLNILLTLVERFSLVIPTFFSIWLQSRTL